MKTDKEINDIIKQGLEEYAKAETKSEDTAGVTFSKEHEEKMKNIFDNARKQAKPKKPEDREFVIRIKFGMATKVAVAAIVVMFFVSAVSTGIKAWKASRLNSYEGSGDYSWLLPNNTSEVYEKETTDEGIEYVQSIFPGLSGEISNVEIKNYSKTSRIKFKYNNSDVSIKIGKGMNLGIDTQNNMYSQPESNEGYYSISGDECSIIWEKDGKTYNIYGNIQVNDALKIIENINYEKIETNF